MDFPAKKISENRNSVKNQKSYMPDKHVQNLSFVLPVFPRKRTELKILYLYGEIWIRENLYSGIFHAVHIYEIKAKENIFSDICFRNNAKFW